MKTHVDKSDIEARIKDVAYYVLPDSTVTICSITMINGFSIRGESACVDPKKFDAAVGRKYAYEKAFDELWKFEGYLLAERLHNRNPTKILTRLEKIAEACHEVNRAYCQALGDHSQLEWKDAPEWQRASARMGADLHLMGNFGPEASHISWMNQKLREGWKYGPLKDPEKKEHPCMVPFDQLSQDQQAKDYIFRSVVHSLAKILN